jgi:hypothetical protein
MSYVAAAEKAVSMMMATKKNATDIQMNSKEHLLKYEGKRFSLQQHQIGHRRQHRQHAQHPNNIQRIREITANINGTASFNP